MRRDIGRWRALANAGLPWPSWRWAVSGCIRWRAGGGTSSRRFTSAPGSPSISGLEAGHRVRLQGMDAGVVEQVIPPDSPASRSSSCCGSTSGCVRSSARTPSPASSPKGWSARASSRSRRAGRDARRGRRGGRDPVGGAGRAQRPDEEDRSLAPEARRPGPDGPDRAGRDQRHRQLDPRGQGIARQVRPGRGRLSEPDVPDPPRRAHGHGPGRQPDRAQADLAAVSLLRLAAPTSSARRSCIQPGSRRDSRTFRAEDLFEPGRAILTPVGRTRLDEVAPLVQAGQSSPGPRS